MRIYIVTIDVDDPRADDPRGECRVRYRREVQAQHPCDAICQILQAAADDGLEPRVVRCVPLREDAP